MSVRTVLLGLAVAVAGFVAVTVVVTELASRTIEFSLFVGLPAGVLAGVVLGVLAHLWLGDDHPGPRRRGAALGAFGVASLGVLVPLVAVGGVRNSQALPIAGLVGVVATLGTYAWYRRSDRAAPPSETS